MLSKPFSYYGKHPTLFWSGFLLLGLIFSEVFVWGQIRPRRPVRVAREVEVTATPIYYVSLQATNGQYVIAESNGEVNAKLRQAALLSVLFILTDKNGGSLVSGDAVSLKTCSTGYYLSAEGGGGGRLLANQTAAGTNESLQITKIRGTAGTQIARGDWIALRAANGQYIDAEGAGGGLVYVKGNAVGPWESFLADLSRPESYVSPPTCTDTPTAAPAASSAYPPGTAPPPSATPPPGTPTLQPLPRGLAPPAPPATPKPTPYQPPPLPSSGSAHAAVPAGEPVALRASNGQYLVAENGGGGAIYANSPGITPWTTFRLVDMNGGTLESGDKVTIQAFTGQYLSAEGGGGGALAANGPAGGGWETFELFGERLPDWSVPLCYGCRVRLRTANGYYALAEGGGGGLVKADSKYADDSAKFTLEFPGSSALQRSVSPALPFFVQPQGETRTNIQVRSGAVVRVTATGQINFGQTSITIGVSFGPGLCGPDGDEGPAPTNFPAPGLRKYSLVCRVEGYNVWYQGGTDRTFQVGANGTLICQPNDDDMSDNSRGWLVYVYVTN